LFSITGLVLSLIYLIFAILVYLISARGEWAMLALILLEYPLGAMIPGWYALDLFVTSFISATINIILLSFIGLLIENFFKRILKG
jgi:hypothetical protein